MQAVISGASKHDDDKRQASEAAPAASSCCHFLGQVVTLDTRGVSYVIVWILADHRQGLAVSFMMQPKGNATVLVTHEISATPSTR